MAPGPIPQTEDELRLDALRKRYALYLAYEKHALFVAKLEAWGRLILALVLVVVIAWTAIQALQSENVDAAKLAQLLTPLAGLAGIAIGYFFGQAARPPLSGQGVLDGADEFRPRSNERKQDATKGGGVEAATPGSERSSGQNTENTASDP